MADMMRSVSARMSSYSNGTGRPTRTRISDGGGVEDLLLAEEPQRAPRLQHGEPDGDRVEVGPVVGDDDRRPVGRDTGHAAEVEAGERDEVRVGRQPHEVERLDAEDLGHAG